jgi:hypothetical protein
VGQRLRHSVKKFSFFNGDFTLEVVYLELIFKGIPGIEVRLAACRGLERGLVVQAGDAIKEIHEICPSTIMRMHTE